MIILIKEESDKKDLDLLLLYIKQNNLTFNFIDDNKIKVNDPCNLLKNETLLTFSCIKDTINDALKFNFVSRKNHPNDTIIDVKGVKIGGENIVVIAGPCAIESEEQILDIAQNVKAMGAKILRGGAYKLRTSPYTFQGLKEEGLDYLIKAGKITGLPIISEIVSITQIDEFVKKVDIIQVGARNMQNYELLKTLGKINKPILLKRGIACTIEEWLYAAEYIMSNGNQQVILCERGIRTFETYTRYTLDLSVITIVKELTHLPIIIDPSHATGRFDLVESISLAAIAANADGLMIEVHNHPELALSDGNQSIKYTHFKDLMEKGKEIAKIINRDI